MAGENTAGRNAIFTQFIQMMPSMAGFFENIDRQMKKSATKMERMGSNLGRNFNRGLNSQLKNVVPTFGGKGVGLKEGTTASRNWVSSFGNGVRRAGSGLTSAFSSVFTRNSLLFSTAGSRSGYTFAETFSFTAQQMLKRAGVALGLAAVAAVPAQVVGGGLTRALNIENAQATLKGLGYSFESIQQIAQNALSSVEGTIFSLDQAVKVSASAIAAGVKEGQPLVDYLSSVADAATIAGTDMNEMGYIYNKIMANGKVWAQELNMLADRGIPIYQWLADSYGVTQAELRDMVTDGEVWSQRFFEVMRDKIGGSALASADTTEGAFRNMRIAFSRFGAAFFTYVNPIGKVLFNTTQQVVDALTKRMSPALENFFSKFSPQAIGNIERVGKALIEMIDGTRETGALANFQRNWAYLVDTFKEVRSVFQQVNPLAELQKSFNDLGGISKANGLFIFFLDVIREAAPGVAELAKALADRLAKALPGIYTALSAIGAFVLTLINRLSQIDFASIIGQISDTVGNVVANVFNTLQKLIPLFVYIAATLVSVLAVAIPYLYEIGKALLPVLPVVVELVALLVGTFGTLAVTLLQFLLPVLVEVSKFIGQNAELIIALAAAVAIAIGVTKAFIIFNAAITGTIGLVRLLAGLFIIFPQGIQLTALAIGLATKALFINSLAWIRNTVAIAANRIMQNKWVIELMKGIPAILWSAKALTLMALGWIRTTAAMVAARAVGIATAAWIGIVTAAQWAWNAALTANPIGIIIVAVAALATAVLLFFTQTKLGREMWKNFTDFLGDSIKNISNWFAEVGKNLGNFFTSIGNGILNFFRMIANFFIGQINFIIKAINFVIKLLNKFKIPVPEWAQGFFGGAKTIGFNIAQLGEIPYFATGADILGPTIGMIGENRPERIIDRNKGNLNLDANTKLAMEAIRLVRSNGAGEQVIVNNTFVVQENMSPEELSRKVTKNIYKTARR